MPTTVARQGVRQQVCIVRQATPEDNPALLALARACPMQADISVAIERDPDFFALVAARGGGRVFVAESGARIVGCASVCRRDAYVLGRPAEMGYVGDIKVLPFARGRGIAHALLGAIAEQEATAPAAPYVASVAAGNRRLDRMVDRWRRRRRVERLGAFTAYQLLPVPRRSPPAGYEVGVATPADEDALIALLDHYHRGRSFAPIFRDGGFRSLLARSPGMTIASYRVARRHGRIVAAVGVWDATGVKRTKLCRLSPSLRLLGRAIDAAGRVAPLPPLPRAGDYLRVRYLRHHAHAPGEEGALAALIRRAVAEARGADAHFALFTCQDGDPVARCLRGVMRTRYRYALWAGVNDETGASVLGALAGSSLYDDAVLA